MGFFKKLKKWLKPKSEKIKDANRVTNYGGGVKRNDTVSEVKRSIQKAEKAKERKQETQSTQSTTRGSAFKAIPQSVKKAEAKDKQTSKPTRSSAFKATPPTIKHQSTALGTMSELDAKTRTAKMNAYNENRKYQSRAADKLKPLIEAKYSGDTLESKQRIKSGEWMSDPNVAKYDVLKHPIANSLARGGLSGATLGLSDLAAAKLTKGEAREAEELYQANKNRVAEGIGTFVGAMLPYAGTAKAFENLGVKAAGRAAETQVGKRLGAEALVKAMSGTGAKSALARSLVGDAIQDSTLGLVDTMAGVAQRDDIETTNDYLKAIAKGQLANYGMGLAGNVVSNAAPAFKAFNGEADRGVSRVFADDLAARATRNANSGVDRINIRDMARKPEVKAEAPKIEVEPKAKPLKSAAEPKSKNWMDSLADSETYDDFVKQNAKNADLKAHMKETGKNPKEVWRDARIERGKQNLHRISDEEADRILWERIPENEVQGWFNDANSGYKPRILDRMAESPETVNASLNVAYKNYLDSNPKNALSFDEWLDTPQTLYRGTRGQSKTADDIFTAFTPNKDTVAKKFAGKKGTIEEITITPRETYGSVMHNLESEFLVPESAVKESATPAPKVETTTKPKTETQKNEIAIKGEQAKTGERTEFKRDAAESVKEQARNKRATDNRQKATQETFDKDFNAFEEKISEAQTLRDKVRAASGEEKEALQKRLDKLNDEIKSARNQASLRYHPDRGGSDEWMGKFNDTYKDYKRGSYSSKSFKSAESSTRAKTATGDGGNTPPPRRAKAATGEDGFKKPKGKTKKSTRTVSSVEDLVHKKKQKAVERENLKEAYHVAKTKVVNSMSAFEDANLKTVKTDHEGWKVRNAAVDKTRRHGALAKISVDEGQLKADNKRYSGKVKRVGADGKTYEIDNGQSLKKIYDGMDEKTEAAFDAYLLLKHAPDRIREGTPIFDRINLDRGGGEAIKNLNDPKVVKEEAERLLKEHPKFAKKAEEIYQYTQNELQNRVDAGLLSQETASKWMHDHPFYVPTGRDGYFNAVHGNRSGVAGADSLKAATGSDLDIRSIKEQLAEATTRNWRDITTNDLLEKFFGDKVQTGLSADNGLELLDSTVGLSKSKDGRKFYAKIFRNGDIHRVEIDKRFYDSLEDLYKNGSVGKVADTVARAAQKYYSQPFKNLVTSWNPIFLPKNFSRDMGEAFTNTRQTKEFAECLAPAWKELATDGQYARALRDSGVSQSNFIDIDAALTHKEKGIGKAIDKFVALQDMTESFPRLAEYMATIKKEGYDLDTGLPKKVVDTIKKDFDYDLGKGLSDFRKGKADIPAEVIDAVKKMGYDAKAGVENIPTKVLDIAAANAADVTVNFARGGSVGKNLNKGLVPFFNPSVQGWSKFFRNFREQKGVKSTLGLVIKAAALGAGVNAVNNFLLEDNPNYQRISARDKANNVIIAFPPVKFDKDGKPHVNNDADLFIKIPMSRFATVYGLPAVNVKNENKMGWAEMLKVGKDAIAPVDPTESSIFAPLYQVQKNETWYGTKIVPEYLEENYSPSEQYDTNTSPLGKVLGKATSKLPDEFQVSPKKADYLIDATTGVIGDFALPISTAIANDNSAKDAGLKTLKKAFTIDSTTQNNLSSRFYNKVEKANKRLNSSKSSNADKAEYDRLNSYKTEISSVTKAIKELQNGNLKANQDNIKGLQEIRNDMMQDAIDGKAVPSSYKTLDTIQKHVGTTYAINNFGSSADKKAMKLYGMAKYGELSDKAMAKKMDADKSFYKGVRNIGKLEAKMEKAGFKSNTALSKAVALASVGADDDLFGAYRATKQSRTETANKMVRSRNYFKEGGSEGEYVKLEKARKTLGKLTNYDEDTEIEKAEERLAKGEISLAEYHSKEDEIKYNANRSYVGLATSLAQANAPERGYRLYDIKDKNIQKGINLAAMGITARDFRKMSKDLDSDGNGYPSSKEIREYVANSDIEDKATLYDALYYYKGTYNPFGTPTKYTRAQAAAAGKKNGVEPIGGDDDNKEFNLKTEASSGSWRGGYYRYGRWHRWGSGGGGSGKGKAMDMSAFKGKNASTAKPTYKSLAANLKTANRDVRADYDTSSVKYQTAKAAKSAPKPKAKAVAKKTPPKVKFKKYEV